MRLHGSLPPAVCHGTRSESKGWGNYGQSLFAAGSV